MTTVNASQSNVEKLESTRTNTNVVGTDTAMNIFGACGSSAVKMFKKTENTPEIDEHKFDEFMIITGLAWMFTDTGQNLFLTGPTGAGKSSFVEQFCARIGMPVYVVACHGKLEFNDLIGSWHLCDTGKKWADGPAIRAMKEGSVLLLDEVNFLDASVIGGLNRLFDGRPYYIIETNETVVPHPEFRIACTSNPFDPKYKGVKKMNAAFLDRVLAEKVDYLDPLVEAAILNKKVPGLSSWIIDLTIGIAGLVRTQFKEGEMETTISTRGLIRWGKMIKMYGKSLAEATKAKDAAKCSEILNRALGTAVTNRADPVEQQAIEALIVKTLKL